MGAEGLEYPRVAVIFANDLETLPTFEGVTVGGGWEVLEAARLDLRRQTKASAAFSSVVGDGETVEMFRCCENEEPFTSLRWSDAPSSSALSSPSSPSPPFT